MVSPWWNSWWFVTIIGYFDRAAAAGVQAAARLPENRSA